jgi:MFS family permease
MQIEPGAAVPTQPQASFAAWYSLAVLTLVTLFATIDRQMLTLLAEPIRGSLRLSDLQLGLLQGTGIAIFTALTSYPVGWLADRFDRRWVLAACLLVWSTGVVGCGIAQDFPQLFIAGAMVGAADAGLIPIVYSLIPDLFRERKRQLANSIYAVASITAGGLALALGGQLIGLTDAVRADLPSALQNLETWRLAFFAAALPAPLMLLLIATTAAGRARPKPVLKVKSEVPNVPLMPFVRQHKANLLTFSLGCGLAGCGFASVGTWATVVQIRVHGQTPEQVGTVVGVIYLSAIALAFALSVVGTRLFTARLGVRLPVRAMWLACAGASITTASLVLATNAFQVYATQSVQLVFVLAATMLTPTAIQALAPGCLRARLVAIQGMVTVALSAAGPPLVGWLSDQMKDAANGLVIALVSVAAPCLVFGALLLRRAERGFATTAKAAEQYDEQALANRGAAQAAPVSALGVPGRG